jgi:hypothetical protein
MAVPPQRFGSFSLRRFSFSLSAPFFLEVHGLAAYIHLWGHDRGKGMREVCGNCGWPRMQYHTK